MKGITWMHNLTMEKTVENPRKLPFKNPKYHNDKNGTDKKRIWRSLKQIIAIEKSLVSSPPNYVNYISIEAPTSSKPSKKYSDISGLPAKYKDPITLLYYASAEEYSVIKTLPSDIVSGYLNLRKAMNPLG